MPKIDYAMFVRIAAAVFSTSAVTAFVFAIMRLLNPELFYTQELIGSMLVLHYLMCGLVVVCSAIGLVNSGVVMFRPAARNAGRNVTLWLLLDSLFETVRVLYLFFSEVMLKSSGSVHMYDLILGAAQYLIDSLLYCQVILKKQ